MEALLENNIIKRSVNQSPENNNRQNQQLKGEEESRVRKQRNLKNSFLSWAPINAMNNITYRCSPTRKYRIFAVR